MGESYRNQSRKEWHRDTVSTQDDLKIGCLQRIADATEVMAKDHAALVRERDYNKLRKEQLTVECDRLSRRISALRGVITRMKKTARAGSGSA